MKKIQYIFSFILLLVFCNILCSCPWCNCATKYLMHRGKVIYEYPDWCCTYERPGLKWKGDGATCLGFSQWIDWQSEEGKKLHNWVDDRVVEDDFRGKFRILVEGQGIIIGFSDKKGSSENLFAYIGDYTDYYQDRYVIINTESDIVEYDCWLRRGDGISAFNDKCQASNKAKVTMIKIDDSSYRFILSVANDELINVILKNESVYDNRSKAKLEKTYSWLPLAFDEVVGTDYWDNGYYGDESIIFHYEDGELDLRFIRFCFEGISFRAVDEENKKISFWLEDRNESDFADYLEIHITDENWTDCPERGATEKNSLMKGTLGFYKEGNPNPVCFYDEAHSEFSRLVD